MSGIKVEEAKRSLVRFIREGDLAVGDRLPPYSELRQRLGFSTDTVHSAVSRLRADGVLEVRNKVGVFVRDTQAAGHIGGTVGIALYDVLYESAFNNFLVNTINVRLNSYGFMTRLFSVEGRLSRPAYRRLEELPGLARSVRSREFDAMFAMVELSRQAMDDIARAAMPLVTFATHPESGDSLAIDFPGFIADAFAALKEKGCRRIGIVYQADTWDFCEVIEGIRDRTAPEIEVMRVPPSGEAFFQAVLNLRGPDAPDGIISVDDTLIMDMILTLFRHRRLDYQPWIAVIRNRHASVDLPWEKQLVYQIDLLHLADFIVEHILNLLKSGRHWPGTHWYRITRLQGHSTGKGGAAKER